MACKVDVIDLLQGEEDDLPVSSDGGQGAASGGWCSAIVDFIESVLEAEGVEGRLTVAIVDEEAMAGLNTQYRGVEGPTDVLSFCYAMSQETQLMSEEEFLADLCVDEEEQGLADLGEIAVCPSVVARYAAEEGEDPDRRFAWSVLHGVLHLLGYDHETDAGEMFIKEQVLLRQLEPLVKAVRLPGPD
ncbi:MAG: rRNA maturation RNase YbeY [Thermoleophilia bacterium]|nr:rRNA maturation RNase YbeY [Thermoleophilia bacterium]